MTEGHTHPVRVPQLGLFQTYPELDGIKNLPCATPATCDTAKLGRAVRLLERHMANDPFAAHVTDGSEPSWVFDTRRFLASLSPSRSSAEIAGVAERANSEPSREKASLIEPTPEPKAEDPSEDEA